MRQNHFPAVHHGPAAVRQGPSASPARSHPPVQVHQRGSPEVAGGAAKPNQRMSKYLDGYRRMIRGESGAIKADPIRGFLEKDRSPGFPRGSVQKAACFAQYLGRRSENSRRAGLQLRFDQRQEAVADAVAQEALVQIRKVLAEAPTGTLGQMPEIGPRHRQQGAKPRRPGLVHGGEAAEARASQETEQDGLRLVISGVAENDPVRLAATGQAAQAGAPDASGDFLQRRAALPDGRGACPQAERRESEGLGQVPHPRGVVPGSGAKGVIDVPHDDPPAAGRGFGDA